jgi:AbiU2
VITPSVELGKLIESGLVTDIFRMERSHALLKSIGECAEIFNDQKTGNFGDLFGTMQEALQTECLMAAARIFDPPGRRYPNRGLRHVLEFIRTNADQLPAVGQPQQLRLSLRGTTLEAQLEPLVDRGGAAFSIGLADQFLALVDEPERVKAIEALKTLRDKALAHNEHVENIEGPTWKALGELIDIAKKLVAVLGWAYLGTAYEIEGDFLLTDDAKRPSYALERLAKRLLHGVPT